MPSRPISVVIPAHDEAAVIARLLDSLGDPRPDDEIVVVCDGCTDATAQVASGFPGITVVTQPQGGKASALNGGDRVTSVFPRFYVDADIQVTLDDLRSVAEELTDGIEAGAPRLTVDLDGASWLVRRYYDIWMRLPYASVGTIGSGVIGLSEAGRARFGEFPDLIADDEMVRRLFAVTERLTDPPGTFVVTTPRRLRPLIDIKTRSHVGRLQLDALVGPAPASAGEPGSSSTSKLVRDPRRWPSLAVFVAVRAIVRARSRRRYQRGDLGWDRDESSREGVSAPSTRARLRSVWAAVWRTAWRVSARDVTSSAAARSCLVVAPHPDDETLGCGATIARKRASGAKVTILTLTDGSAATGSKVVSASQLGAVRRRELVAACSVLGVAAEDVHQLAIPDGALADHLDVATATIADLVVAERPDEVFVTAALDAHSDHRAAAAAVRSAVRLVGEPRPRVLEYPIWAWASGPGRPRLRWFGLDGGGARRSGSRPQSVRTGGYLAQKRRAMACHRSQTTNLTGEPTWSHFTVAEVERHMGSSEVFFAGPTSAP